MAESASHKPNRRKFLKRSAAIAAGAAGIGVGGVWLGSKRRVPKTTGKKVIIIGIDGMDPRLCQSMMKAGKLPNLSKLRAAGGFSPLGTSMPPQSPVAWANFINGAGPGSHGIFDFFHRHLHEQCRPYYSASDVSPGEGGWEVGAHELRLDFWPFNHKPPTPKLMRQGVPFWEYLDAEGVPTTFYDLPSNYPPSPSQHGHHRCLSGMGTPDMLGSYGTYQHFSEACPPEGFDEGTGKQSKLTLVGETAKAVLVGPENGFLKIPRPVRIEFLVHRDRQANAAVIEIQGRKILLKPGQWSRWTQVDFELSLPWFLPNKSAGGICRFFLQSVAPPLRLYVTPINIDPSAPAMQISEPTSFVQDISEKLGLFYTTGFQEDYFARINKEAVTDGADQHADGSRQTIFTDDEFLRQASMVLEERLALFEYAVDDYDDGLLFFYFSSSDLQSHMFWWSSEAPHPTRAPEKVDKYFGHIHRLYQKLDAVIGDIADRYGSRATIFVISDHGFTNFGQQFNLNSWLREMGYLQPAECRSILDGADWSLTEAYGLGFNGLYLNLKGREPQGTIEPGKQQEAKLTEIAQRLLDATDPNSGAHPIRGVYRSDQIYSGEATALAPDLIIGYYGGFRTSWDSVAGRLTPEIYLPNDRAWSADHCVDALEVPGILFSNRPFKAKGPALIDVAPSILAMFGLPTPRSMSGKNIFAS
jgi:predicted AlkP superfamily phosphohydrolase/phosphomutase